QLDLGDRLAVKLRFLGKHDESTADDSAANLHSAIETLRRRGSSKLLLRGRQLSGERIGARLFLVAILRQLRARRSRIAARLVATAASVLMRIAADFVLDSADQFIFHVCPLF